MLSTRHESIMRQKFPNRRSPVTSKIFEVPLSGGVHSRSVQEGALQKLHFLIMAPSSQKRPSNNVQAGKGSKMQNLIDYRVRISMNDGRQLAGLLMAFDKFMNIVLGDTEEFRRTKRRSTTTTVQAGMTEQEEK